MTVGGFDATSDPPTRTTAESIRLLSLEPGRLPGTQRLDPAHGRTLHPGVCLTHQRLSDTGDLGRIIWDQFPAGSRYISRSRAIPRSPIPT